MEEAVNGTIRHEREILDEIFRSRITDAEIPIERDQIIMRNVLHTDDNIKVDCLESGITFEWNAETRFSINKREITTRLMSMWQLWRIQTVIRTLTMNPIYEEYTELLYTVLPELERYSKGRMTYNEFDKFYSQATQKYAEACIQVAAEAMTRASSEASFNERLNDFTIIPTEWSTNKAYYDALTNTDLWNGLQYAITLLKDHEMKKDIREWMKTEKISAYRQTQMTGGIYMMVRLIPKCLLRQINGMAGIEHVRNWTLIERNTEGEMSIREYKKLNYEISKRKQFKILDVSLILETRQRIEFPQNIEEEFGAEISSIFEKEDMWTSWIGQINETRQIEHIKNKHKDEENDIITATRSRRFRPSRQEEKTRSQVEDEESKKRGEETERSTIGVIDLEGTMSNEELEHICKQLENLDNSYLSGREIGRIDWANVECEARERVEVTEDYADIKNGAVIMCMTGARRSKRYRVRIDEWTREVLLTRIRNRLWA